MAAATILHLSADYPDPLSSAKTRAVHNLLTLVPEVAHRVYSLNRVGWREGVAALPFGDAAGDDHRAVAYGAPPMGLFLLRHLDRLADWIAEDAARRGVRPDAVHAHKLSVEGPVGLALAKRFGVPLLVSVQGNSDLKIVGAKRGPRPVWREVWTAASTVLPFAPWAATGLTALLGPREGPVAFLPCPGAQDETILAPRVVGPLIRSAFHLGIWRLKNAGALIDATGRAARSEPEIRLEIAGGGDPGAFARLTAVAGRSAPGRVAFLGAVPNPEMGAFFNGAAAVALVSRRESFGMVFAEALHAGAPCLIPRGRAIDGYLPEGGVVVAADPSSTDEIVDGLLRLTREEAAFKARLAALTASGGLELFRRSEIARTYRAALDAALAGAAVA